MFSIHSQYLKSRDGVMEVVVWTLVVERLTSDEATPAASLQTDQALRLSTNQKPQPGISWHFLQDGGSINKHELEA